MKWVVPAASALDNLPVMVTNAVLAATSTSGNSMALLKGCPPGWITISAPAKPPKTSSQRSIDTRSFSAMAETRVIMIGLIMTIAVNSPIGMCVRLRNASELQSSSNRPRTTCRTGWRVANGRPPWRGSSTTPVNSICIT